MSLRTQPVLDSVALEEKVSRTFHTTWEPIPTAMKMSHEGVSRNITCATITTVRAPSAAQ